MLRGRLFCTLLVLLTPFHLCRCDCPNVENLLDLQPLAFNASQNDYASVVFRCFFVNETSDPIWKVNGRNPLQGDTQAVRGIRISLAEDGLSSNLTIRRSLINNNTTILCRMADFDSIPVVVFESCEGNLKVQGVLEPPPNLRIVAQGDQLQRLTWDQPFTIDITDIEEDISHYIVCENVTGACVSTIETQYEFPNLAVAVGFSVTAVNVVGEGDASSVTHDPCTATAQDLSLVDVSIAVSFTNGLTTLEFELTQESSVCFSIFSIEISSTLINATFGPFIPILNVVQDEATLLLTLEANLTQNFEYMATIVPDGVGDPYVLGFSTFDVQAVDTIPGANFLSVKCTFASGTMARGCHVVVTANSTEISSANATRNGITATVVIDGLNPGRYVVTVFDLKEDGSVGDVPAAMEVVNITELNPTTTSSAPLVTVSVTTTSGPIVPTSGSSSDDNTRVIAGGAYAAVVVVLAVLIIVLLLLICRTRRKKKSKYNGPQEPIPMQENSAYVIRSLKKIKVKKNEVYSTVGLQQ